MNYLSVRDKLELSPTTLASRERQRPEVWQNVHWKSSEMTLNCRGLHVNASDCLRSLTLPARRCGGLAISSIRCPIRALIRISLKRCTLNIGIRP